MTQEPRQKKRADVGIKGRSPKITSADQDKREPRICACPPKVSTDAAAARMDARRSEDGSAASLFDGPMDTVFLFEPATGKPIRWNERFAEVSGYTDEEIAGMKAPEEFCAEADRNAAQMAVGSALAKGYGKAELSLVTKQGTHIPFEYVLTALESADGKPLLLCVGRDLAERRQADEALKASELRYHRLFEAAQDGILILNQDTSEIIDVNPFIESLIGYSKEELIGKNLWDIGLIKDETASIRAFEELQSEGYIRYEDLPLETKDGRRIQVEFVGNVFRTDDASLIYCNIRDITERKRSVEELAMAKDSTEILNQQLQEALVHSYDYSVSLEAAKGEIEENAIELSHQATHDTLTGLPNREYFEQRLRELVTGDAGKKSRSFAVLFLDLDRFKIVNDTLGHKVGDLLLVNVAARLQSCLRSDDILSRLGGDEFTVILPRGVSRETAESVASRVIDSISRPFEIHGHRLVIGVSVGLASYPSDGADTVALVKHADAAMYSAKQSGRGQSCWYSGDMDVEIQRRADMETDIRMALDEGRFDVHYQPIMSLRDGKILAAEALLRWDHPEKGMLSPSLFIPIAEEIGVMGQIGQYVLRTACAQTMAWRDEGIHLSQIAVNVSTRQVCEASWLDSVSAALSDTGLDPQCLNLEVTETDFAADYQSMKKTLRRARELGICIAIDDFGTGHSLLRRLKDFPVVLLKIDGSFVRDIEYNTNDNALVRSIVDMAHGQPGVKVTAEWVETESQMEILRTIGCDYAQGYFISPALAAEAFGNFVREWDPAQQELAAAGSTAK